MPKILDRLPIPTHDDLVSVRNETVRVRQAEIIVWVSVNVESALGGNPALPHFPAIIDTGHTHNFSIQEQQLVRWAGIRPERLQVLGHVRQQASASRCTPPMCGFTTTCEASRTCSATNRPTS